MKVERAGEDFELILGGQEKDLLLAILRLYPRTPPDHYRLTQSVASPDLENTRRLLNESFQEGRAEARQKLERWLANAGRLAPGKQGARLKIKEDEIEWLIQILNEIHVGSWIRLGAPDKEIKVTKLTHQNAADFGIMNMSGLFVMDLLDAIRGSA